MSKIGSLEVITRDLRSKNILRGCSFTVERMDEGKFSNISEQRIIEVEEPETPAQTPLETPGSGKQKEERKWKSS